MNENKPVMLQSHLSKGETIAVLAYIPVHIFLLPLALAIPLANGSISEATCNLLCYGVGAVYMVALCFRFLRRDFDPLCDRPFRCVTEILSHYLMMMGFNLIVGVALSFFLTEENPNNSAIMEMAGQDYSSIKAIAVFLAPLVEEMMFRAGIFGTLRKYNRTLAYIVAILAFSLYHVWGYVFIDRMYLLYMLQYIPVSFLLCRCYERTESIWCSIFFHMLVNGVALNALSALESLGYSV